MQKLCQDETARVKHWSLSLIYDSKRNHHAVQPRIVPAEAQQQDMYLLYFPTLSVGTIPPVTVKLEHLISLGFID
jgi:hypothetical protein